MKKTLRSILACVIVTALFLLLLVLDAGASNAQYDHGATLWMWEMPRLSVTTMPDTEALPLTFVSPLPDDDPRCVFLSPVFTPSLTP